MLDRITAFALRNRFMILTGTAVIMIVGIFIIRRFDIDIFPELTAPTVAIMTEASGMAPEEVEKLVSFPIETIVNGSTGIRRVRSNSTMGFSIVWVEFEWGTDIYQARQTITERLFQARELLPMGVDQPVIAPQTSLLGEIMIMAIESDSLSQMDLRTFADWTMIPRLQSVPGIAQVTAIGGEKKEYQILADPLKMNFTGVSFKDLAMACENMNNNSSGGFISEYGSKYIIRGMGRTNELSEIEGTLVRMVSGNPVRIKDVTEVVIGNAPRIGTGSYMGRDAVLITITKQPDANTVKLTGRINEAVEEIRKNAGPLINFHTDIYNQASFIKISVNNVLKALIEGGFFVIIVLFFFLLNSRTTLISLLAIPLSLIVTIVTMKALGYTINTMSLGGMAIAIGSLVDDAVIYVENIYKRLRMNVKKLPEEKEETNTVIFEASAEMRSSILNATVIIIITFMPLFFLEGFEGRMLKPLGITFIISLLSSLIIAVTITPVLCSYLLDDEKKLIRAAGGTWTERKLGSIYRRILGYTLDKNSLILGTTGVLLIMAAIFISTSGSAFLPAFNEGSLTINIGTMPGISLDESASIGRKAENTLLQIPEVMAVSRKTGRAELAEHSFGENFSELDVPFVLKERSREEFLKDVRNRLKGLPGTNIEVGQPVTHRIDNMLSGTRANIAIKVFGDDLNTLFRIAGEIKASIDDIEGIGDLNVEQLMETPQIKIKPRREMLARHGITSGEFSSFISNAFNGKKVSDVYENEKRFPLILRYNNEARGTMAGIKSAMIDSHNGIMIPLSAVADVESSSGPDAINRENVRRKIVISVNTTGSDMGTVIKNIRKRINETIALPENYSIEYSGQFESAKTATLHLVFASIMAIMIIFLILYQEFRDRTLALIILLNLPLALIGGAFAIKLSSDVISIPSIIGFITLFGIATRNGILLISRYIKSQSDDVPLKERIISGSVDRLNPILMTAFTAALALIPLAAGGDKPGNEIQSPMAIVILGGLLSSTLLNLIIIPAVYMILQKNRGRSPVPKPVSNNQQNKGRTIK
ncbi:MAG: efflux RND transporter permease subunit [Bacteroidales bacterium]|jgi:CzcA family heavy metal efflux pump|nr:efflux RND transporter permease subunit [Bacteroidales bacterium]